MSKMHPEEIELTLTVLQRIHEQSLDSDSFKHVDTFLNENLETSQADSRFLLENVENSYRSALVANGVFVEGPNHVSQKSPVRPWTLWFARKFDLPAFGARPGFYFASAISLAFFLGIACSSVLVISTRGPKVAHVLRPVDTSRTVSVRETMRTRPVLTRPVDRDVSISTEQLWQIAAIGNDEARDKLILEALQNDESALAFLAAPRGIVVALVGTNFERRNRILSFAENALDTKPYGLTEIAAIAILVELRSVKGMDASAVAEALLVEGHTERAEILGKALTQLISERPKDKQAEIEFALLDMMNENPAKARALADIALAFVESVPREQLVRFERLLSETVLKAHEAGVEDFVAPLVEASKRVTGSLTRQEAGILSKEFLENLQQSELASFADWSALIDMLTSLVAASDVASSTILAKQLIATIDQPSNKLSDNLTLQIITSAFLTCVDADDTRALIMPLLKMISENDFEQQSAIIKSLAPRMSQDELKTVALRYLESFASRPVASTDFDVFLGAVRYLPTPERLRLYALAMKYPTVNVDSIEQLVDAMKSMPAFQAAGVPDDYWSIIRWLGEQPGIDIDSPPPLPRGTEALTSSLAQTKVRPITESSVGALKKGGN